YEAHCAELLHRVAAGEDTRPGTSVEIARAIAEASLAVKPTRAGFGVYLKAWQDAFGGNPPFPWPGDARKDLDHLKWNEGQAMDDMEAWLRRKMSQPRRRLLPEPECHGEHHGRPAPGCPYYRAPAPAAFLR